MVIKHSYGGKTKKKNLMWSNHSTGDSSLKKKKYLTHPGATKKFPFSEHFLKMFHVNLQRFA